MGYSRDLLNIEESNKAYVLRGRIFIINELLNLAQSIRDAEKAEKKHKATLEEIEKEISYGLE